jgi:hypothetical protein
VIPGLLAAAAYAIGFALPVTILAGAVAARAGRLGATPWAVGALFALFLVALPAAGFAAAFASAEDDTEGLPVLGGAFTALLGMVICLLGSVVVVAVEAVARRHHCARIAR